MPSRRASSVPSLAKPAFVTVPPEPVPPMVEKLPTAVENPLAILPSAKPSKFSRAIRPEAAALIWSEG